MFFTIIDVERNINLLYFTIMAVLSLGVMIYLIAKKDKESLWIFSIVGSTLFLLEFFGVLIGLRVIVVAGISNPFWFPIFSLIMGFGEGGAAGVLIYKIGGSWHEKKYKRMILQIGFFAAIMIIYIGCFYLINMMVFFTP